MHPPSGLKEWALECKVRVPTLCDWSDGPIDDPGSVTDGGFHPIGSAWDVVPLRCAVKINCLKQISDCVSKGRSASHITQNKVGNWDFLRTIYCTLCSKRNQKRAFLCGKPDLELGANPWIFLISNILQLSLQSTPLALYDAIPLWSTRREEIRNRVNFPQSINIRMTCQQCA